MKVLFLDIDGVLNCDTTQERIGVGRYAKFTGLDAALVKRFKDWLEGKDICIVLSSTWRTDPNCRQVILEAGIDCYDFTDNLGKRSREVDNWLHNHPEVTHYAILDDIKFFSGTQAAHFVRTNYRTGLRDKDLRSVEVILEL